MGASTTRVRPTATHIAAPPEAISAFYRGFALSPDGETLIFSARTADGRWQLWKRRLDDPRAQPLAGTDDAKYPFWSPDGRQVAFFVPGELRRMPAEGGQIQTICSVTSLPLWGSWGDNNDILISVVIGSIRSIYHVSADGGTLTRVSGLGDGDAFCPQWLPGGRLFLFSRYKGTNLAQICAASIDGNLPPKPVTDFEAGFSLDPVFFFSPHGHLFFNRAGALSIQRFDPKSLSVIGQAAAIAGSAGTPGLHFALSAAGDEVAMLAREPTGYAGNPGDPVARLRWLNRHGEVVGDLGPPGRYWTLRLSPDGSRAAVNPGHDIMILDSGNRHTRMTSRPDDECCAVWSPDGAKIVFSYGSKLMLKPATQGGQEAELLNTTSYWAKPSDWSRDGKYLLLEAQASRESTSSDIWLYDFNEKSAKPWLATKFNESQARFSPDGVWVAYSSNANGSVEVYIRPFKGEGKEVPVSSSGGRYPTWRKDNRELFYLSPKDELMAVTVVSAGATLRVSEPQRLFKVALNDIGGDLFCPYDVAPDGQRFLMNLPEPPQPLLFIQGIEELLKPGQ